MDEAENQRDDVTIPEANYFDKATDLASLFDRLMVSVYSALIAGTSVLLLRHQVSAWTGAFLVAALVMFVFGIGHTLLHIAFHTKMLLALEALVNGTEHVPNAIEGHESTVKAYARMQSNAQRAYAGQLYYLFLGVLCGGVGVVVHMWRYSWRAIVAVSVAIAVLLAVAMAGRIWRQGRLCTYTDEASDQESETGPEEEQR